MPVASGCHHLALQVQDLKRAEAFYNGVLGLPVLRRWPDERGGERSVWLDLGDGSFLALERADPDAPLPSEQPFRDRQPGWHLIALRIQAADRSSWAAQLQKHDVAIVHESRWTLYVRDPEGNRVGLSHHPDDVPGSAHEA